VINPLDRPISRDKKPARLQSASTLVGRGAESPAVFSAFLLGPSVSWQMKLGMILISGAWWSYVPRRQVSPTERAASGLPCALSRNCQTHVLVRSLEVPHRGQRTRARPRWVDLGAHPPSSTCRAF